MAEPVGPVGNVTSKEDLTGIDRRVYERFNRRLSHIVGEIPATRVLDVGCGEGFQLVRLAKRFPDRDFIGVDLEHPDLRAHWEQHSRPRVQFIPGDAHALPFGEGEFEMVTAVEVLEHLPDPEAALKEIRRVCRGGWLVASVPLEPIWRIGNFVVGRHRRQFGNTPGHVNHWTRGQFRRLLAKHGRVEHVEISFPWTLARVRLR
jgi:ubiquinone/menaquinone biosynthesis C-methylase UbiE